MKKIDKLILTSFIGPLILTFAVVIFILLSRQMLYYFDDIIGKDLGGYVLAQFLTYFAILTMPAAMPLAILLASLITFGNLAEHFELTAVKASGISLPRVLLPIFVFVLLLTGVAFYANNKLVPKAALQAYTLLYDIKKKKPALDIREGVFYDGLPGVSIKVNKKFAADDAALKDIILYDHRAESGNMEVLIADSGRMTTILHERYLKLEFFEGYQYSEVAPSIHLSPDEAPATMPLTRRRFSKIEMVIDLSSFDLSTTDASAFSSHYRMHDMAALGRDIDSMHHAMERQRSRYYHAGSQFAHGGRPILSPPVVTAKKITGHTRVAGQEESLFMRKPSLHEIQAATDLARKAKEHMHEMNAALHEAAYTLRMFEVQRHKIPANALACIAMFLIGAPLGTLIRRGGLGVPFLVSIFFFIIYTLLGMQGEDLALQELVSITAGVWTANMVMLLTGLRFLYVARHDGRLFEGDTYRIDWRRFLPRNMAAVRKTV